MISSGQNSVCLHRSQQGENCGFGVKLLLSFYSRIFFLISRILCVSQKESWNNPAQFEFLATYHKVETIEEGSFQQNNISDLLIWSCPRQCDVFPEPALILLTSTMPPLTNGQMIIIIIDRMSLRAKFRQMGSIGRWWELLGNIFMVAGEVRVMPSWYKKGESRQNCWLISHGLDM